MKCPKCGKEIQEGSLFCEFCFADIRIVPTYDTQIEQSIANTLDGIRKNIGREDKKEQQRMRRLEELSRLKKKAALVLIGAVIALLAAGIGIAAYRQNRLNTVSYYVGEAYRLSELGEYFAASEMIGRGLELEGDEDDKTLLMLKADYLRKAGMTAGAIDALNALISQEDASDQEQVSAYGKLISLYAENGEYDKIADILAGCNKPVVQQVYSEYMVFTPQISPASGEYEDAVSLEITSEGNGSIFYTLDGQTPDMDDLLYQGAFELEPGEHLITAAYINHFGVESEIVSASYIIGPDQPSAPVVTPDSGSIKTETRITVESEEDTKVYYTTDGSDPTADSKEYTGPITIPLGTSRYKFIAVGSTGKTSEITEAEYTYTISGNVTQADGANYIIVALIRRGEVVDTIGTIARGDARFVFTYQGLRQISGYGNFLIYSEQLMDDAGNTASTGRVYAVNITNGTVNLFSEQGGKYTLTPIG